MQQRLNIGAISLLGLAGVSFCVAPHCESGNGVKAEKPDATQRFSELSKDKIFLDSASVLTSSLVDAARLREVHGCRTLMDWSAVSSVTTPIKFNVTEHYSYRIISLDTGEIAVQYISSTERMIPSGKGGIRYAETISRNYLLVLNVNEPSAREFVGRILGGEEVPDTVRKFASQNSQPTWVRSADSIGMPLLIEAREGSRVDSKGTTVKRSASLSKLWSYGERADNPHLPSKQTLIWNPDASDPLSTVHLEWYSDGMPRWTPRTGVLPGRVTISGNSFEAVWFDRSPPEQGEVDEGLKFGEVIELSATNDTLSVYRRVPGGDLEPTHESIEQLGYQLPPINELATLGYIEGELLDAPYVKLVYR